MYKTPLILEHLLAVNKNSKNERKCCWQKKHRFNEQTNDKKRLKFKLNIGLFFALKPAHKFH